MQRRSAAIRTALRWRVARRLYYRAMLRPGGDPHRQTLLRWLVDRGDETLRLEYPLHSSSIVFDVGGHRGDWADAIVRRYGALVYVFEPLTDIVEALERRFSESARVHVLPFGLLDRSIRADLSLLDDGSSLYRPAAHWIEAEFRDIVAFMDEHRIDQVDLMKLNIEGAEFAVLRRLIDTDKVARFKNIQVQFHNFVENADAQRESIRRALRRTHTLTYDYPFVWENWQRRE
jgi:FkbM family methyltransferase